MAKTKAEPGRLFFWKVPVEMRIEGPLHATSPDNKEGIAYMLAPARQPSSTVLAARQEALIELGDSPIPPIPDLMEQVLAETAPKEGEQPEKEAVSRFRHSPEDPDRKPFVHENYVMGHLRDAGKAISRAKFWGLEGFISQTSFVRPKQILLLKPDGDQGYYLGADVKIETWPAHFDIYRMGRVSSFRHAEWVESPVLRFYVLLTPDPKWTRELLEDIFNEGAMKGIGGGRGRRLGNYDFTLGEWEKILPAEARKL